MHWQLQKKSAEFNTYPFYNMIIAESYLKKPKT